MIRSTRYSKQALLVTLLTYGCLFGISSPVYALGGSTSLTTSPVTVNSTITPGSSGTTVLRVMNNDPKPVPLSVELETFSANGTNGQAKITPLSPSDPSFKWVHFSKTSFIAQPGIWSSVTMTIDLPKTASLGYYYAVLFKPTDTHHSTEPHATTLEGANAILVLLDTNSSNEDRNLSISQFTTSHGIYEYLPVDFNVRVKNKGNIYLPPSGDIYISRNPAFTSVIATLPINPGQGNILPNSSRDFGVEWSDGFPVFKDNTLGGQVITKNGKPVQSLHWNFSDLQKFRFGKYYARVALVYRNGNKDMPLYRTISFWVLPWKLMSGALLLLIIVAIGLFGFSGSLFRRARKHPLFNFQKPKR